MFASPFPAKPLGCAKDTRSDGPERKGPSPAEGVRTGLIVHGLRPAGGTNVALPRLFSDAGVLGSRIDALTRVVRDDNEEVIY